MTVNCHNPRSSNQARTSETAALATVRDEEVVVRPLLEAGEVGRVVAVAHLLHHPPPKSLRAQSQQISNEGS